MYSITFKNLNIWISAWRTLEESMLDFILGKQCIFDFQKNSATFSAFVTHCCSDKINCLINTLRDQSHRIKLFVSIWKQDDILDYSFSYVQYCIIFFLLLLLGVLDPPCQIIDQDKFYEGGEDEKHADTIPEVHRCQVGHHR